MGIVTLSGDNGHHRTEFTDHLPSNEVIGVDAVQGMVRNHTIEMALRKCYGNTFS